VSHAGGKGGKNSTVRGCVREVLGMNERGSTDRRRSACSYAVAGGRQHATQEARARRARARDRIPGGAPPCGRWRPRGRPNEPQMASHAAALVRVRGWGGAGCCGPARAGGVPETAQGGAFEAPRTASSATRPHAAPPTRQATPTLARGLVRAPVSARSPPRGSG